LFPSQIQPTAICDGPIKKPQSFIAKYEREERRLDFVETLSILELLARIFGDLYVPSDAIIELVFVRS
jgi:hypothetical protein